jgi:TonB family protein
MISGSMRAAIAAAILLSAGNVAAAASQSHWLKTPGEAGYRQVWPAEAVKQKLGGRAIMRCRVDGAGLLSACQLIGETPAGYGFGQALLSLAPQYQMRPDAIATQAPNGEVIIPADWFEFDKAPDWLRKPSADDLLVVWPRDAWRKGLNGKASIDCIVSAQGALFDCVVLSESPPGQHFGSAALALVPQFLMRPAIRNGQPVLSQVAIPINFAGLNGSTTDQSVGVKMVSAAMAWPEAPSYADVAVAYPPKAKAAKLGGRATLNCEFTATGRLRNCNTVTEEPRGQGFADAAKVLAKHFQAFAKTSDGTPLTGAGVQLPFVFDPSMLTDAKPLIGKPAHWGLPSTADTLAAFTPIAKQVSGTVRVVLACAVQPGGGVGECTVEREDPLGQGAGQAALALAAHVRVTTWTVEGLPTVGGTINIPIRYEAGAAPPPAAKP